MWVKRMLVILPVLVMVFLLHSFLWVPNNQTVAQNPSRVERLILYMGSNPEDMNRWTYTKTNDSEISDYLVEGMVTLDQDYNEELQLAESVTVSHQFTVKVPQGVPVAEFEARLRKEYGEKLRKFQEVSTGGHVRLSLDDGKELGAADDPADKTVFEFEKLPVVKVLLAPKTVKGEITFAVDADVTENIEKWFGPARYQVLEKKHLAELALKAVPDAKKEAITASKVEDAVAAALKKLGDVVSHEQFVDFQIRRGVHWVDGPFFKREDLIDKDIGKERRHFGDVNGPWWVEGPEVSGRDLKLTLDYLRDPDFGSPRMSGFVNIAEVTISENDPFHVQVRYEELYSLAVGDLGSPLLPYHIWNRRAWTEEATRRGKGPNDVGVPDDPSLGQWEPVPKGKYKPHKFLPAREREYSLRPSSIGYMVIEPLNGDALPLWRNGSQVRLRRNEFYYGRKPEYQFIDYYIFDANLGRETTEIVFMSGGVDAYGCKPYQVERYAEMSDRYQVVRRQGLVYEYLSFNCQREQVKDPEVRKALSMAINVEDIIKYVMYDQATRINGPAYPVLPWYDHDHQLTHTWLTNSRDEKGNVVERKGKTEQIKYLPYDLEEARAILIKAGYQDVNGKMVKDGKPLRLELINTATPGSRQSTALLAKEQWEKLGVDVDYKEYEWNVFIQQYVMALKFDVCVLGWSGGTDFDKRAVWHSDYLPTSGGMNLAAYKNPAVDILMDKIIKVFDTDRQVKLSREIFREIADDYPYVFLFSPIATSVYDKRIVWRKEVRQPDGSIKLEDRPLNHDFIKNARTSLKYFYRDLKRVDKVPEFKEEDYHR